MQIELLRNDSSILDPFRIMKYKYDFCKNHPYFFKPFGTCIFCGPQGSGKTLSAVNYVYQIADRYPYCIIVTNCQLRDYPFTAHLNDEGILVDDATGIKVTSERILNGEISRPVVPYTGLKSLTSIHNGEYGVVFFIDEIHLELNSLESQNIDIEVMIEISQQRKQRKHIIGTSQIFMRMAKPVREQVFDIILCHCSLKMLQFNKLIDGTTTTEKNGKLQAVVKARSIWFHKSDYYDRYDTYAKMKRYNHEWKGRAHSPVNFFEPDPQLPIDYMLSNSSPKKSKKV